eukprot:1016060-Prymnesium_polylepis.1
MRMREAALRARAAPQRGRQPRHPCTPRVCSVRLHSGFTPTQTLGHASIAAELEIAIFAAVAPKLKVVWSPSKSRPAIRASNLSFVA